jgi:Uma2 family endonuclease
MRPATIGQSERDSHLGGSLGSMPTLVGDPQPAEFEALLERRRHLGQDLFDEVWQGVYHMNPAPSGRHADVAQQLAVLLDTPAREAGLVPMVSIFNLGEPGDYRVPDGGLHRERADQVYYATAALVLEIVSPNDKTWEKLPFYAAHGVDEVLVVDPEKQTVQWFALAGEQYEPVEASDLIALAPAELAQPIDWP